MDLEVPIGILIGLELGRYLIKTINFYRDTRNPTPCHGGFCSFAHSLYSSDKAKKFFEDTISGRCILGI